MTIKFFRRKEASAGSSKPAAVAGSVSKGAADTDSAPDRDCRMTFRFGLFGAVVPLVVFLAGVITYFMIFEVFDINALTASGLAGLLVGALFARSYSRFWECVITGVSSRGTVSLLLIFLSVGLVVAMINQTDVAGGMVWLAGQLDVGGGWFVLLAFVMACAISMATGSSLGTMFTAFPIFYPAGVMLGASPTLLAGAILSGAVFGDNLAPISDSSIMSASTQRYRRRDGVAEISGVVRSRAQYALIAAGASGILFLGLGLFADGSGDSVNKIDSGQTTPLSLTMLIPIAALLVVAFWKRNIFMATTTGLLCGLVTGLLTGLLSFGDIFSVGDDGDPAGVFVTGIETILPLVGLAIVIFGIIGVLQGAGVFDIIVGVVSRSGRNRRPVVSELTIGFGAAITTVVCAGVNTPAILMFGPVADRIGAQSQLHPYRRANIMDCFVLGIGGVVPVASIFLLISSQLTGGYGSGVPELTAFSIFTAAFYPLILTLVILLAVLTGWGRRFEGENGVPVRQPIPLGPKSQDRFDA
ncbi:Na+/H+ antiporter NhaC family protein [Brevibacterium sp. FAM 24638]|uniref:Na+/H+ antiporter NhaC family protein n=1 Tax=Brevibacterium sp. FAM 24638 TaxID=3415681 RepID=UPI003C7B22CC